MGCNINQKLKLTLCKYIGREFYDVLPTPIVVSATGLKTTGWVSSSGYLNIFQDARIVSFDDKTLYLLNGFLYKSTDNGLNWYRQDITPSWGYVSDVKFNSKGWMYILTSTSRISYSKNMEDWNDLNNGFVSNINPLSFWVDDNTVLVNSKDYYTILRTEDNGSHWDLLDIDERIYAIGLARHSKGDIYFFNGAYDLYGLIWKSKNNGDSWEQIDIGEDLQNVTDFKINNYDGKLYIATKNAALLEVDVASLEKKKHSHYEKDKYSQHINNIVFKDDDVLYLVNKNSKSGIFSKNNNWSKLDIGFNKEIINFYKKSDNTFLLISEDGVYCYVAE